jgi:Rrf2 family protein
MRLQKASIFALYAMLELARDPERQVATGEIAEKYGISTHHLAKVMRELVRAGLVQSARGARGGYLLRTNPNRITMRDVICLFEDIRAAEDTPGEQTARATPAGQALNEVWSEIGEIAEATLDSITLRTLLNMSEDA